MVASYLNNTLYKLKNADKFKIGYFGGSITEGAGASDFTKSWQGHMQSWFKEKYPYVEITNVQAAIGGTGSGLGIYRCDYDLLKYKPDLVFYEFAVNDSGGSYDSIMANTESIFKKILKSDPNTDIIVIYTTTKQVSDMIGAGHEYVSRAAHSAAAHKFGFMQIDVGEVLRAEVAKAGGDWLKYTTDNVHPNDDGYRIYADCITGMISGQLEGNPEGPVPHMIPETGKYILENAYMTGAVDVISSFSSINGWKTVNKPLCGRYPNYIEACAPGAEFTYEFTGSKIGIYTMFAKDSGDLWCSIDGGEEKRFRVFDAYCLSFNRIGSVFLCGELEYGKHTVKIRVAETKDEHSKGNAIRIGAFLIS